MAKSKQTRATNNKYKNHNFRTNWEAPLKMNPLCINRFSIQPQWYHISHVYVHISTSMQFQWDWISHPYLSAKKKTIFLLGEYQNNVGTPNAQWMELTNTQMCVVVWKQIYVSSVFVLKNNRMNELCLLIDSAHKIYQCFNTCCYCCCCCCLYRRFRTFQWVVITENGSTM